MSERIETPPVPSASGDDHNRLSDAVDRLTAAVGRLEQTAGHARERTTAALTAADGEATALREIQRQVAGRLDAALLRLRRTLEA